MVSISDSADTDGACGSGSALKDSDEADTSSVDSATLDSITGDTRACSCTTGPDSSTGSDARTRRGGCSVSEGNDGGSKFSSEEKAGMLADPAGISKSMALRRQSLEVAGAVQAKDGKATAKALQQLNLTCDRCHKEFRKD